MTVWLLSCSIKAGLLLAASWFAAALLRRGTAAARHQIWALGVVGALLLPLLCWALPSSSKISTIASTSSLHAPAMLVTSATVAAPTWPAWLAIIWIAGALAVAFRSLRGHLAARRLVLAARPSVHAFAALPKRVRLLRSETIRSPMTIGVLRPCVLLPAAADRWSPDRIDAVLVHELGHVRRHDTVIQLAAQLACALYWWNPLAWLAAARLRIEREHACDDLVLGGGVLPSTYAADLLDVARSITQPHVGAICMVDLAGTDARLRRILDAATPRRPLRARFRLVMSGLALACAVMLACTSSPPPSSTAALGSLSVGTPFFREPVGVPFVQDMSSRGSLDLSLVTTEVKRRLGGLEQCYERRLGVEPKLAGTVVIHWNIAETGEVREACITEDTVGDQDIIACVNKLVLEGGPFPKPRGGSVDVSMPFVFTARPAVATR